MRFVGAGGTNVNVVWYQTDRQQLFLDPVFEKYKRPFKFVKKSPIVIKDSFAL